MTDIEKKLGREAIGRVQMVKEGGDLKKDDTLADSEGDEVKIVPVRDRDEGGETDAKQGQLRITRGADGKVKSAGVGGFSWSLGRIEIIRLIRRKK